MCLCHLHNLVIFEKWEKINLIPFYHFKVSRVPVCIRNLAPDIDILCDDYSGTFTFQMRSYFLSFFIDQDVPPETKGYLPEPDCLGTAFVVYFVNKGYQTGYFE